MPGRSWILTITTTLLLTACGVAEGPGEDPTEPSGNATGDPGTTAPTAATSPAEPREPIREVDEGCEHGGLAFDQPGCEPAHSVPLDEIVSGGPPPDGIPPIDEPVFESIEEAGSWLEPTSPVMVVDVEGDVRAYPLAILTWHEIVNDVIGDRPLVVTYCPLCNSALVFDRTVERPGGTEVLDFGTSGRLYRSNLVMYDRQTNSLWTQFEGEAIVGEQMLGARLERRPAWLLGFERFTELHPDGVVLSRDTGHDRDYGRNPYTGYDTEERRPFLFRAELDDRFPPMRRFVGLTHDDAAVAIDLELLADEGAVTTDVGDLEVVTLWAPGQASALDEARIDEGTDVGQTAAFDTQLADGTRVDVASDGDGFVDRTSGSSLDLRGRFTDGPLDGQQLTAHPHDDTFWFVWVAFRPDTRVLN